MAPWILNYLTPGINEEGMKGFHDDDDEYHLAERLVEFWETADVGAVINVILKFNRYSQESSGGSGEFRRL